MSGATEAPIIVLVRPQLGENIGKAARAMLNFGLTEMRLVEPRGYFRPPSRATATRRTLRSLLTKPGWNHLEVRTLRGVLSALAKGPRGD